MCRRLEKDMPKDLLDNFQIIPSRVRELDETKVRILWCHDLPGDPESEHLKNGGWNKFHRIVFVSYWQRDAYIRHYNIPHSVCSVILNAIDPIEDDPKADDELVRLVYHTTPHRGLELLVPVFEKLQEKHSNLSLEVYSSFKAYGWDERDKPYKQVFERMESNPHITSYGFQPNETVRKSLAAADIFAYPCIWQETSCIALMEAMSAGLICVHSDLAALAETSANWTLQYNFHEDLNTHAGIFYNMLDVAIELVESQSDTTKMKLRGQKSYADLIYNWQVRKMQWQALLESLVNVPRELPKPKQKEEFVYKV